MLLKALIHFISCNSLALGYLAAAVPHWQIPFVMPSLSPQPETHWFFFSLLQPYPIHSTLLDMKHFNFCSHIHQDSKGCFLFHTHFPTFQTVQRSLNVLFIYLFCFCLHATSTFVCPLWCRQNNKKWCLSAQLQIFSSVCHQLSANISSCIASMTGHGWAIIEALCSLMEHIDVWVYKPHLISHHTHCFGLYRISVMVLLCICEI